jgi:hypothetical protein
MIKAYKNSQVNYFTKGLAFYAKKKFKFLVSYTWLNHGKTWTSSKGKEYSIGYDKLVLTNTTNKSVAVGRVKFNFVTPTNK